MRNVLLILLMTLLSAATYGEGLIFDLVSRNSISVRNTNNFSLRILVRDGGRISYDAVLQPQETGNFFYEYSRQEVRYISYEAVYDTRAFEKDLSRIEYAQHARENERLAAGMVGALGAFLDQTFTGGKVSSLIEIGSYLGMITNGASEEEWQEALTESAIGNAIDGTFDKNYQKGLALGVYEIAKSLQPQEYEDLKKWLAYFVAIKEEGYRKGGYVTETARLPKRKAVPYPSVSFSGSYPLNQKFAEDYLYGESEVFSLKSEEYNGDYPFEARFHYRNSPSMGFFLEYGKTNLFRNSGDEKFRYLTPGSAFRYTTYSFGISPSASIFELSLGASYLQQENFVTGLTENSLQSAEGTRQWAGFAEPRINIPLGKPFTIFGSWRATLFSDKSLEDTMLEILNFKVGLSINFHKRILDFTN